MISEFRIARGNNGKGREYCSTSAYIVAEAEELGMTTMDIVQVTGADRRTVSGWRKNGGGDVRTLKILYDHIKNLREHSTPIAVGNYAADESGKKTNNPQSAGKIDDDFSRWFDEGEQYGYIKRLRHLFLSELSTKVQEEEKICSRV
jgi:hypothetical protein